VFIECRENDIYILSLRTCSREYDDKFAHAEESVENPSFYVDVLDLVVGDRDFLPHEVAAIHLKKFLFELIGVAEVFKDGKGEFYQKNDKKEKESKPNCVECVRLILFLNLNLDDKEYEGKEENG
jgi:hypothetical protein